MESLQSLQIQDSFPSPYPVPTRPGLFPANQQDARQAPVSAGFNLPTTFRVLTLAASGPGYLVFRRTRWALDLFCGWAYLIYPVTASSDLPGIFASIRNRVLELWVN